MRFKTQYEGIVKKTDGTAYSLGLFDKYNQAEDACILEASKELPTESVVFYQIIKLSINMEVVVKEGGVS